MNETTDYSIQELSTALLEDYLAYLDGKPVGWCNAGLSAQMTIRPDEDDLQVDRIGSIVCFVVAKPHRGKGIARRLLEAVCEGFRQQGLELAETYPRKDVQDEASNHYGPLAMYLDAGFKPFRETDDNVIVRKILL